jgi:WhiB family transcriptional regulator, redox-sensing transcriptional regulator
MPEYQEVDWEKAECRGTNTELFYQVEEERSTTAYPYINAVRSICGRCPIWFECLSYAFNHEGFGVWGGMTSQERRSIYEPDKYPMQRARAIHDLKDYGITLDRIKEAHEHSGNVGSMDNRVAYYRKNGAISDSRPRE